MSWSGGCIRSNAHRDALVAAARALVADGVTPTVELTAERARTSLTTAYRYFPSQAALLAAVHPEITMASLLPPNPPTDVGDRLEHRRRSGDRLGPGHRAAAAHDAAPLARP